MFASFWILALFLTILSAAAAGESAMCGMSCTKDATICGGGCGVCMSENNVDYFCGAATKEQIVDAYKRVATNVTVESKLGLCGTACSPPPNGGTSTTCTSSSKGDSCYFCGCGTMCTCMAWAENLKVLVPQGFLKGKF
ncbi:MAG: hypothetical protein EOP51_34675 [Sphingobacteriales bacterium]|nr:MAG: hypothetical protein EOP51_34675 [Sphingobacteriales bacterium]